MGRIDLKTTSGRTKTKRRETYKADTRPDVGTLDGSDTLLLY
jgi:hypothetical protein